MMSQKVKANFAGDERSFLILRPGIQGIEKACDCGIGPVATRLARATAVLSKGDGFGGLVAGLELRASDVRETIYHGLLGGGMSSPEATRLLQSAIDDRGFQGVVENASLALRVLWGDISVSNAPAGDQTID